jgi:hypothetical protein
LPADATFCNDFVQHRPVAHVQICAENTEGQRHKEKQKSKVLTFFLGLSVSPCSLRDGISEFIRREGTETRLRPVLQSADQIPSRRSSNDM